MYLADLMEKSEAGQFIVLSYLQQHSTSSLKDVMSETGFSKATLTKYISLINDKAMDHHATLSIQLQDETLSLSVGPDTKGRDIRRLFLDNSKARTQLLNPGGVGHYGNQVGFREVTVVIGIRLGAARRGLAGILMPVAGFLQHLLSSL